MASAGCASGVVAGVAGLFGLTYVGRASATSLGADEQLRLETYTGKKVFNGPGLKVTGPLYRSAERVKALTLGTMDYVLVKDTVTGTSTVERGPKLLFLDAYEVPAGALQQGVTLGNTQYMFVENKRDGKRAVVKGPCVWFPESPFEVNHNVKNATTLQQDEFIRLKDLESGKRWIEKGKKLLFLQPSWVCEGSVQKAWTLRKFEYVRLLDKVTGLITVERGEKIVFPGDDQELVDGAPLAALDLKVNEYVKIVDQNSGKIRVEPGPQLVFLGANEKTADGGKKQAIQVDETNAVLVRDTSSGQLRLITEKQLFMPKPNDVIEEVRGLISLADHEAMIVKDKEGTLHFHYGNPEKSKNGRERTFFLQPHEEVMQLWWSSGLRRAKRDLCIERFDCRSQYMWFEFDTRTKDNVELILECTFFWEVTDLAKMVRSTGNLPGDIYNQARSQFIKQVASFTLREFMDKLHEISKAVYDNGGNFYSDRGVKIHSLEVTRYSCSEKRTSEVLQQIIEETTNRLNRLSQAESENEVKIYKMNGQIEWEKLQGELLEIQNSHQIDQAKVQGDAEASRFSSFIEGIKKEVPDIEQRIAAWNVLRKGDALQTVSSGKAQVYFTPNDVNLSIESRSR